MYTLRFCCLVAKPCPTPSRPHGLQPARLLCPWDFPGRNPEVGSHFLLQGIFSTQGLNLHLSVPCIGRWILYYFSTWEALSTRGDHYSDCYHHRWVLPAFSLDVDGNMLYELSCILIDWLTIMVLTFTHVLYECIICSFFGTHYSIAWRYHHVSVHQQENVNMLFWIVYYYE